MIRAIVGTGPRVGSSFVMRSLIEAGLPVHWNKELEAVLPSEGNPSGYFETHLSDLHGLSDVICKVWPLGVGEADIERMVVLERGRKAQLRSIELQIEREKHLLDVVGLDWTPEDFLDKSLEALQPLLSIPHLRVRTEDLDERIQEIINYMRY